MIKKPFQKSAILGLVLFLGMALCLVVPPTAVHAESTFELEYNDIKEAANSIEVNTTVVGNLFAKSDVDWYTFTTTEAGYFYLFFQHGWLDSSKIYWNIYLYDASGVNTIDGPSNYYIVAGNSNLSSRNCGIPAGTYYIKIQEGDDYYSSYNYELTVRFVAQSNRETEDNNSFETADRIDPNQVVCGSISMPSDVDFYVFIVEKSGYFYLSFKHMSLSSSDDYWNIYLFDWQGKNLAGNGARYLIPGDSSYGNTLTYRITAGVYYIGIKAGSNYSVVDYSLTVNYTPATSWEKEYNNEMSSANELSLNQLIHGSVSSDVDEDWYTITLSASSQVAITLNHKKLNSSAYYWKWYLYDSTGETEIMSMECLGEFESSASNYVKLSAGTYYIKVVANIYSQSDYSLSVTEKHQHSGAWETTISPTCFQEGELRRVCAVCGYVETNQPEPVHDYNDGIYTKQATLTQKGEIVYTCLKCGNQVKKNDVSKLWILPVICVVTVAIPIGVFNYIRAARKKK